MRRPRIRISPRPGSWRKRSHTMKTEWMTQGKCGDLPWDVFFPGDGEGVSAAQRSARHARCHTTVSEAIPSKWIYFSYA
jgi:hypothetical protein